MSEVIGHEADSQKQVLLGDEASQQAISLKLAQAFYGEITGKSERITEKFNKPFILKINDIDQLHKRVIQSTTQYSIVAVTAYFSVSYKNDSSERFSSIERFMAQAASKGEVVEEVDINYNFLFILPETNKPQEYKINIKLVSRIAKLENIKERTSLMPFTVPLWQFDDALTCKISIDYIDITVANAFMSVIRVWHKGLEEVDANKFLKIIRPFSKFLPSLFKYGLLTAGVIYTFNVVDDYFGSIAPQTTAVFILIAYLFNFMLWKVGMLTGRNFESNLDQMYDVSYISFSEADNKLARNCRRATKKHLFKGVAYLVGTFFLGVTASGVASMIFS